MIVLLLKIVRIADPVPPMLVRLILWFYNLSTFYNRLTPRQAFQKFCTEVIQVIDTLLIEAVILWYDSLLTEF
jgi:hypothetical protein